MFMQWLFFFGFCKFVTAILCMNKKVVAPKIEDRKWWTNPAFVRELDRRHDDLESGGDKGLTLEELKISIELHKQKRRKI
ncbi:hypothetical protein CJD36_005305 [Flavipsychrobacter stenotrophus]|uniref:Uncharacterized protein n=1 Tax=Flavipsychrobacter stenotrophus TaxID=2077091 RepID=A0A2S7SWW3_9BACT|nr:hypothetical protein CJD36_005305 [Flavipsychrobacter stenotrophus]